MKQGIVSILVVCAIAAALMMLHRKPAPPTAITQDAYIWQHSWTQDVANAATMQQSSFHRYVVLMAEITPRSAPSGVILIRPDYSILLKSHGEIGIAIRISKMSGTDGYEPDSPQSQAICSVALQSISDAQSAGLTVSELQLDYDCAQSKLGFYRKWIKLLKPKLSPVPVVITALPSWLNEPAFSGLAKEAGSFVMQVHSLQQPKDIQSPAEIFDAAHAEQAVERAAKQNVPFRVALPTYSYLAAFDPQGKFIGLSGEGRLPDWSASTHLRMLRSDPAAIAPLVKQWIAHPPANMMGIIWYRLPVERDALNWSTVTLRAVMAGQTPSPQLVAEVEKSESGSSEIYLKNTGDDDWFGSSAVKVEAGKPIEIAEPISGFVRLDVPGAEVIFKDGSSVQRRIAPGERIQAGWVRVSKDTEVHAYVVSP